MSTQLMYTARSPEKSGAVSSPRARSCITLTPMTASFRSAGNAGSCPLTAGIWRVITRTRGGSEQIPPMPVAGDIGHRPECADCVTEFPRRRRQRRRHPASPAARPPPARRRAGSADALHERPRPHRSDSQCPAFPSTPSTAAAKAEGFSESETIAIRRGHIDFDRRPRRAVPPLAP